jgi:hypothetical protein
MMRTYNPGDAVLLTLDGTGVEGGIPSIGITPHMRKYKDRQFIITKAKFIGGHTYYELRGFVSESGVPYTVASDYITPIRPLHDRKERRR